MGFIAILLFPIAVLIRESKNFNIDKRYINTTLICVAMFILSLWYNNALKIEYAYMAYFVLAIIPISIKSERIAKVTRSSECK